MAVLVMIRMGMIDGPSMIRLMMMVNGSSSRGGCGSSEGIASSSAGIIAWASHNTAGGRNGGYRSWQDVAIAFDRSLHRGRTVGYVF